jgi:hypothetical protein
MMSLATAGDAAREEKTEGEIWVTMNESGRAVKEKLRAFFTLKGCTPPMAAPERSRSAQRRRVFAERRRRLPGCGIFAESRKGRPNLRRDAASQPIQIGGEDDAQLHCRACWGRRLESSPDGRGREAKILQQQHTGRHEEQCQEPRPTRRAPEDDGHGVGEQGPGSGGSGGEEGGGVGGQGC